MKEYTRICPKCKNSIFHKTKASMKNCEGKICRSCSASEINKRPGLRDNFVKRYATRGVNSGVDNAFYGKKHSIEAIDKIKNRNFSSYKTPQFRKKISNLNIGNKNPMFGKSFYDVWLEKYGKEEADKKLLELKTRQSELNSGTNNSMYGKPAPQGSGNGWSGWYKNWYFRSLRELTYMINVIEKDNKRWVSGEASGIKISYLDWSGKIRNVIPDFLIDDFFIVEIKPTRLFNSPQVRSKSIAAIEYCKEKSMIYDIVDPGLLEDSLIKELRDKNQIKFIDRYEKLFEQKYID